MASKVNKRKTANIKGILSICGDRLFVEVEDIEKPFDIADFLSEFNGLEVTLSVSHKMDLGGEDS